MKAPMGSTRSEDALIALQVFSTIVRETFEHCIKSEIWDGTLMEQFKDRFRVLCLQLEMTERILDRLAHEVVTEKDKGFGITLPPNQGGSPSHN